MYAWGSFFNYRSIPNLWATFFHGKSFAHNFDKKLGWAKFWAIFHKLIWSTWLQATSNNSNIVDESSIVSTKIKPSINIAK
jgi:hypothetical protein